MGLNRLSPSLIHEFQCDQTFKESHQQFRIGERAIASESHSYCSVSTEVRNLKMANGYIKFLQA